MVEVLTLAEFSSPPVDLLAQNLAACRAEVEAAAQRSGRSAQEVAIVVVTKYVDAGFVRLLGELGVRDFGESRVQEAERKASAFASVKGARLHLVGHLQRNKAKQAVGAFSAVHSLDSLRLAQEIEARIETAPCRLEHLYVEVNTARLPERTGIAEDQAAELLSFIARSARLAPRMCGLMCMAPYDADPESSRPHFRRLRELRDQFTDSGLMPRGAGLSMGMSADFSVAVEEGASVVRVGTRIFAGVEALRLERS
jgi:hypothetical protein